MFGDRFPEGFVRHKVRRWRETARPDAVAAYAVMFGVRGLADPTKSIARPLLALAGAHDAEPMRLAAATAGYGPLCEDFTAEELPGCGHYPMQETPTALVAQLERFLTPPSATAPR